MVNKKVSDELRSLDLKDQAILRAFFSLNHQLSLAFPLNLEKERDRKPRCRN